MVQLKKKVTLKTKSSEEAPVAAPELSNKPSNPSSSPKKKGGSTKWLTIVILVVLLLGGYWWWSASSDDSNGLVAEDTAEQTSELDTQETDSTEKETTALTVEKDIPAASSSNEEENSKLEKGNEKDSKPIESNTPVPAVKAKTEKVSTTNQSTGLPSRTLEEKAKLVIRGNYGNGEERRINLGSEYTEIQNKVNEMYRNGLIH